MRDNITTSQRLTAAGILGVIAATTLGRGIIAPQAVITSSVGYGIGSSAAVGLFRLADLMKNGNAESNKMGSGIMAGLAIAFGMTAIQTVPDILSGDYINGLSKSTMVISGLVGIVAGYLQSRSSFVNVAEELNHVAPPNYHAQ